MIDILDPQARMLDQKQCSLQSVQSMKVCQKNDQVNHFAVLTDSTVQTALWQVITGQAPDALMKLPVLSPPTPVLVPTPTPVPDFTRFKGTWYAHARQLIIQPNGTASYSGRVFVWCTDDPRPPCDNMNGAITGGMNTQITFTSVNGNTANGSITGGTGDRDLHNTIIPVGSNLSVTLNENNTLAVSDGSLLCGPNVIKNNVDPGCNSGA